MPLNEDEDLLTPREVAEMMGVRTTTVARWARTGVLKPLVRTPGGHRRFRRTDAVRLYQQGWSIRQVATRFNTGYGAMRRILLRHTNLRNNHPKGGPR